MRYQSGNERVSFGVEPAPRVAACAEPLSFGQLFARQLRDRLLLALTRPVQTIADERAWRGFLLMSTVQTLGEEQSGRRADFGESRGQPATLLAEALIVEVDQPWDLRILWRFPADGLSLEPQVLANRLIRA